MANKKVKDNLWGYFFIAPQMIGFLVFSLIPTLAALVLSFFEWDIVSTPKFTKLNNFKFIFQSGSDFFLALKNTVIYIIYTVPIGLFLALIFAVLLNNVAGKMIYRAIFFMPTITNSVAISLVWMWLFNGDFGVINTVLKSIGINGPQWLTDPNIVMLSISIMSIWWGLGYNITIFLAGLQSIPHVYYEAATIDGANAIQKFFNVTVPLISPTTFFVMIMSLINGFQVFDQIFIMTNGGPAKASYSLVFYIYQSGFKDFQMGIATSVSMMMFLIIMIITILQFKFSNKWVFYDR
ncbi:carbohydrate ABC transporter permease [Caldicellulosiruptoraceae bacterium PP1]